MNTTTESFSFVEEDDSKMHTFLCYLMIILSIPTFIYLTFVEAAPYGKHVNVGTKSRGTVLQQISLIRFPAKPSWIVMESPNLFWACYFYSLQPRGWIQDHENLVNVVLLVLFVSHYINRTIIYPIQMSSKSQPMPLTISSAAFCFCTLNGYIQSKNLFELQKYPIHTLTAPTFIFGIMIFCTGMAINIQSDSILRNLRRKNTEYVIPRGGMFEWISCPNMCGEILEWGGFALACGFSLPAVAFFLYTCANLVPRAVSHHEWYNTRFDNYPVKRKAWLPLIW
mmetsp:Transcript_15093/g.17360  ORF Transcript_15093/g.17360 Transcript_15093/m.17360 type:complete len:282 (-) Transcript_15093:288-1133(-)